MASRPAPEPVLSTRDRLLDAAARVITRDGFHGARLVDVAREAGLTTGAIYSNFRDKEELFLAAFDRVQGLGSELFPNLPHDLEGVLDTYRESAVRLEGSADLQVLTFELALLAMRNPRVRAHLEQGLRESVAEVAARLPGSDGETQTAAALMLALGNGVALIRMFAPDLLPLDLVEASLRRLGSGGTR